MTQIFFTADYHLNHANIIKYCNRPFKNIDEMNQKIIQNHNNIVTTDDVVYHLGDFSFKKPYKAPYWEKQLNGKIIHIMGNHDKNNDTKACIKSAIMEIMGLKIYATHLVSKDQKDKIGYTEDKILSKIEKQIIPNCDLILCGHVHNNWKHIIVDGKFCINVGVDVWNFQPVSIHSLLKYLNKIKRGFE